MNQLNYTFKLNLRRKKEKSSVSGSDKDGWTRIKGNEYFGNNLSLLTIKEEMNEVLTLICFNENEKWQK